MTVAKAMKSPGQKTKTPKKGPTTPNVKSPKEKGVGTPAGTPKQKGKNLDKTPKKPVVPANGTPKPKTPNPNGTTKPQTPNPKGNATPKSKTPKSAEPPANVTPSVISQKPNKSPKSLGKRSAEAAGLDSKVTATAAKLLRIYNLPDMEKEKLMGEVKKLLEPRGEIIKMKREKGCIVVEYAKGEDARAAKKLNGVVVGGRHLTFVHSEDRNLPTEHRITITHCPNSMTDEDVWSLFGSCGKILSIHFNRHWKTRIIQKCFVTFDNKKAVQQALSKPKTLGGKTLSVAEVTTDTRVLHAAYPAENTVYLLGLPADVADIDVKKFVGKVCPVTAVTIVEASRRYAIVYITNESDVEKALKLNGAELNGTKLKAERSRKSAHYKKTEDALVKKIKKEVPTKKQKLDKKAAQAQEESEDDDEDEDEDDDDEDEDDDDDDDSEDLLAAFQGKMQKLKQKGAKDEDNDEEEEEDDDDDDDDEDDDEDDEDDEDGEGDDDEDEEGDDDEEEGDDDQEEDDDDDDDDDDE